MAELRRGNCKGKVLMDYGGQDSLLHVGDLQAACFVDYFLSTN